MKIIKLLFTFLLTFIIGVNSAFAVCETSELNKVRQNAYKVSTSYDLIKEEENDEDYTPPDGLTEEEIENFVPYNYYFNIYINNVSEDLYVVVKDSISGASKTFHHADTNNGVITIKDENFTELNDYTIDIYAENVDCGSTKIRTINYRKPKYNEYSGYSICEGLSSYYLCKTFIDFDIDYNFDEVYDKISNQIAAKEKEEEEKGNNSVTDKIENFLGKNKIAIIVGGIIVGAGVATTIVIMVRRRRVA